MANLNKVIYKISLDMHSSAVQTVLRAKLNDTARRIECTLNTSGKTYQIPSDCTAVFRAKKPDNTTIFNDCIVDNNKIAYEFTEQTAPISGVYECEITLYGADSHQITSPRFAILVEEASVSDGLIESTHEFGALATALADAMGAANVDIDVSKEGTETTVTITNRDGYTKTATILDGEGGSDGNGIASATLNADYTLTFEFTDGTSYTTPVSIRGEQGEQGIPGTPLRTVNNASAIDSWIASPGAPVTYALCMADVSSPSKGYDFAKGDVLKYTLSSQTLAVAYSIVGPRGVDGQDGVDGESIVSFNTTDAIDTYIASYAFPHFFFVWGGTEATEYEFTKADGTSGRKSLSIGDVFGVTINTEVHKIVSFDGTKGNIRGAKGNTGNTGAAGADGADGKPGSPVPFTDTSAAKTYLANNLGSSQTILILNASETNMLFLTYTVAPNEVWAVANDADHTGWRNATFTKRGSIIGTNGADGKNAYPMTSVSSTSDITAIQTALSSGTYASSDAYAWVSTAFDTYVKGDLLHITTSAVTVTYHYDTYDIGIDDEPTEGSQNLVRSGGAWAMIQSAITDAIGGSY